MSAVRHGRSRDVPTRRDGARLPAVIVLGALLLLALFATLAESGHDATAAVAPSGPVVPPGAGGQDPAITFEAGWTGIDVSPLGVPGVDALYTGGQLAICFQSDGDAQHVVVPAGKYIVSAQPRIVVVTVPDGYHAVIGHAAASQRMTLPLDVPPCAAGMVWNTVGRPNA